MARLKLPKERNFTGPALVWKRIAAFMIDMIIIYFFVLFPFGSLFDSMVPEEYSFSEAVDFMSRSADLGFMSSVSFIMSIFAILYFYLMEKKMQQTIGKALMKIYVVSDNNDLKRWQLFVRNIVFIPLFPFVLLWLIDPLFMFFNKTNQRLSEILSKTKVVQKYRMEM